MPYDHIIIGAGSAGCVLADRLTADGTRRVLLLESGPRDTHPYIRIPAAFFKLFKTRVDWAFYSVPQRELYDRRLFMPRGRTLGGSGSINAMIYIRGHREDYDEWERDGCTGWGYDSLLPYFKRAENNRQHGAPHHGTDGPWHITDLQSPHPLTLAYLQAAKETGLPFLHDMNAGAGEGAGIHQVNQHNGARHSPADAYLRPALKRPNLTVRTGVQTERILIENRRATGVEIRCGNRAETIRCTGDVIVSAGSILSPVLLMNSGIGPADELQKHGIRTVHALPGVGKHLQDHPAVPIIYRSRPRTTLDTEETAGNILRWLFRRSGPMTSNLAEGGGFFSTEPGLPAPDMQIHFAPAFFTDHGFTRPKGNGFSAAPILVKPKSRGQVTLQPGRPRLPLVDPGVFTHPDDLDTFVKGFKKVRDILLSDGLSAYRREPFLPGSHLSTDEAIRDHVRRHVELLYHPVGTCRMGTGPGDVVSPELRVHGIENLRVADASVMPSVVRGNTQAPTIAVAEKAADLVLGRGPASIGEEQGL